MHRGHQSYHPCGNKFLQKRWDESKFSSHRTRVKVAKPMVDTQAPKKRPHVTSKLKKQQVQTERQAVIDRDNYALMSNMQGTLEGEKTIVDHRNDYEYRSLNNEQRRRELSKISSDNHTILSRLHGVKAHYRAHDWLSDWQKHQTKTKMITAFPDMLETYPGYSPARATTVSPPGKRNDLVNSRKILPSCLKDVSICSNSSSGSQGKQTSSTKTSKEKVSKQKDPKEIASKETDSKGSRDEASQKDGKEEKAVD